MEIEHAVCLICLSEWLQDDKGKEIAALVYKGFGRRNSHSAAAFIMNLGISIRQRRQVNLGIDSFTERQAFWVSLSKSKLKSTVSPPRETGWWIELSRECRARCGFGWCQIATLPFPPGRMLLLLKRRWGVLTDKRKLWRQVEQITEDSWEASIHYFYITGKCCLIIS